MRLSRRRCASSRSGWPPGYARMERSRPTTAMIIDNLRMPTSLARPSSIRLTQACDTPAAPATAAWLSPWARRASRISRPRSAKEARARRAPRSRGRSRLATRPSCRSPLSAALSAWDIPAQAELAGTPVGARSVRAQPAGAQSAGAQPAGAQPAGAQSAGATGSSQRNEPRGRIAHSASGSSRLNAEGTKHVQDDRPSSDPRPGRARPVAYATASSSPPDDTAEGYARIRTRPGDPEQAPGGPGQRE